MAGLSQITASSVLPVTIPWTEAFADHRFQGRPVLPAVAAMQVLSAAVPAPAVPPPIRDVSDGRFEKFLFLNASQAGIQARVEWTLRANGDITAVLGTRLQRPAGGIGRTLVHAAVTFPAVPPAMGPPPRIPEQEFLDGCESIASETVYSELVPFGPAFQNVTEPIRLWENGAAAFIRCSSESMVPGSRLPGSPFVLDAALHAVCVWGQRYAGVVAFPVGFEHRRIAVSSHAGERYLAHVVPVREDKGQWGFDLWIWDSRKRLVEAMTGLLMRDVSQGRLRPPGWLFR